MLIKPLVTEKTVAEQARGKYAFWVGRNMTKTDIKRWVERLFGVHVKGVQTIRTKGKSYRTGKRWRYAYKSDSKKAIVSLGAGERIELFDLKNTESETSSTPKKGTKRQEKKTGKEVNKNKAEK